jgi:hypothetical protein
MPIQGHQISFSPRSKIAHTRATLPSGSRSISCERRRLPSFFLPSVSPSLPFPLPLFPLFFSLSPPFPFIPLFLFLSFLESVEDTKLSTNKQHTLSLSFSPPSPFSFCYPNLLSTFANPPNRRKTVKTEVIHGSYDEYFERIVEDIERELRAGRATLIVFPDKQKMER